MKTLKISFGIAAFAIAVTGALVTKATTQMTTRYIQQTPTSCVQVSTTRTCDADGSGCTHETSGNQLFKTQLSNQECDNPIQQD